MAIPFACTSCSARLKAADGTAGKKTRCLVCDAVNVVPAPGVAVEAIAGPDPHFHPDRARREPFFRGRYLRPGAVPAASPAGSDPCAELMRRHGIASRPPSSGPTQLPEKIPVAEPERPSESVDESQILHWLESLGMPSSPNADRPAPQAPRADPVRRPCRRCGHPMLEMAVRCSRCGETYGRRARELLPAPTTADGSFGSRRGPDGEDRLTTVDCIAAFLLPDICFLLGVVRVIRRRPAGGKLIGAAIGFFFLRWFLAWILLTFWQAGQPAGPS